MVTHSMYPIYKVSWRQKRKCIPCGTIHSDVFTYGFHTQGAALYHAIAILKEGSTLLYIEL